MLVAVALLVATPCWAQDKVTLQLKWPHAFQFAGYYAAQQQGYYRAAGLDVDIREGGSDVDVAKVIQDGKADFGVCTTSVLLAKPQDPQITVLGVIYQHSPAILLVPSRAGISTLSDLKGHRIMDSPSNPDVAAMLKHEGVDYAALPRVDHNGDPRDLISGKADAFVSYSTDEPFVLGQLGAPYRIFSPRAYGFDFYGDNLCTSAAQVSAHPDRTRAFLAASLKGWDYALKHKEQMVDFILRQYPTKKTREALLFEALQSEILIEPGLVPLGTQTAERWQSIANTYHDLGMLADTRLPDTLIYQGNRPWAPAWLAPALLGLVFFAIATVLAWLLYKQFIRRIELGLAKPKLSMIMAGLFICLTIPILFFILVYNYQHNSEAIIATLRDDVEKARQAAIENIETMIQNVAGTLRMVAEMAGDDPGFFRTEKSRDVLYQALASAPEIDGIYVSFEDGYHRVVTRIDDDRRRSDPEIPAAANWHSSFIDDFSAGANRQRHRTFFDTWENVVAEYSVPTTIDMRTLPGYAAAKESRALVVTEPSINPDTGAPVLSVRVPISRNGEFIGVASANITLGVMSRFLATHRASRRSTTIIANPADGSIVAAPEQQKGVQVVGGKLDIARLQNIDDADVREAYRLHTQTNQNEFLFSSPRDGQELSASFALFPESFGRPWEAVILTPTDDFIGQMKATNQKIVVLIISLSAIELLLIYLLSRRLAQPIESISRDLKSVEAAVVRSGAASPVQGQRDCPAPGGGRAAAQFVAVVFRIRPGRRRQGPDQIGHSARARRRKAKSDDLLLRSRGFLDTGRANKSRRSAGADVGLLRAGLTGDFRRARHRRQVHRRWHHGVLGRTDRAWKIMCCALASGRCGRRDACSSSMTTGAGKANRAFGCASASTARACWSATSARPSVSATRSWATA